MLELNNNQKEAIADYIFTSQSGTLIKSEGEAVKKVFVEKGVEGAEDLPIEENALSRVIIDNIPIEQRDSIMEKYFADKL